MPFLLSHLGEEVVAEMADRKREEIVDALGLYDIVDRDHINSVPRFAFPECKLARHGGLIFDGASRVDVVLWVRQELAIALELKLGKTGLEKKRIDDKFLRNCQPSSHTKKRWAGNMMAILDRRFGEHAPADGLSVEIDDETISLSRDWFVVARRDVLAKWIGDARPAFSAHTRTVTIGQLVDAYGGHDPFNTLVTELLPKDFYGEWINGQKAK